MSFPTVYYITQVIPSCYSAGYAMCVCVSFGACVYRSLDLYIDRDFRLVGVHVWNYICDNINIDTPFASFKRILKKFILSEKFMFYLI